MSSGLARMLLNAEEQRRKAEQYVQAYREKPETEAEIAQIEALARESLRGLKWEPEARPA